MLFGIFCSVLDLKLILIFYESKFVISKLPSLSMAYNRIVTCIIGSKYYDSKIDACLGGYHDLIRLINRLVYS